MSQARLLLPERAAAGDVITVRLLVQHPMETGYRQDMNGRVVPRNVIRWVRCELDGTEVFSAETSSGFAANPLFEFRVRAVRTADWLIRWEDDRGMQGELRQRMVVI